MENENNQNYQNNQGYQTYKNSDYTNDQQNGSVYYDSNDYPDNQTVQKSPESKETKPPFDSKLAIIVVQLVMCAAIIAVCLVLKSFCGDLFSEMKSWYIVNVEDKTSTKQVLDSSSESSSSNTSSESSSQGSSFDQSSSNPASSSSNVSSGKGDASSKTATSSLTAEGGRPDVAENSFSFDAVKQTMAKTSGAGNSLIVPVKGTISSYFGYRTDPISGVYSFHDGLDIAANTGTIILAAMDGIVETAERDTYYGNYVVIIHSNNFKTLYAHCSTLKVKAGQQVKAGDTVALVGSTGRSTGPHLHFEVQIGGEKINPLWLLGNNF